LRGSGDEIVGGGGDGCIYVYKIDCALGSESGVLEDVGCTFRNILNRIVHPRNLNKEMWQASRSDCG
jgi:hypothetical protein